MRINNRVIETEYLLKASPEEVYRYLLDEKNKDLRYSEFVLNELINRKEKLIDLAIGQIANNENIFKKLYAYDDRSLRVAILENNKTLFGHLNPFSEHILGKSWLTEDQFLQILKDQNFAYEKIALFSNSSFSLSSLEEVYYKNKPYNLITEDEWFQILHATSINPNIKRDPDNNINNNFSDGLSEYHDKKTITKIWLIANTCTVNEKYGRILKDLIVNLNFDLPVEEFPELTEKEEENISKSKPELNSEWFKRLSNKKLKFLHLLLERWKGKDHDPNKNYRYNENGHLRNIIASKAIQSSDNDYEIKNYLENHPDLDVRQGCYSKMTFSHSTTSEDIQKYYDKDKENFINSVIYNDSIYLNYKGSHVRVRNKIYNLMRYDMNLSFQLSTFYRKAEQLSEQHPKYYFYDLDSLYDEFYEEESSNSKPLTEMQKFEKIQKEMKTLNNQINNNSKASQVEKRLSDLNYKITEILEEIIKKNEANSKKLDALNSLILTSFKFILPSILIVGLLVIFIK